MGVLGRNLRARRSAEDRPLGMGEASGSNPDESILFLVMKNRHQGQAKLFKHPVDVSRKGIKIRVSYFGYANF